MDVPAQKDDAAEVSFAALLAEEKPSRSWLWAPLLVVGLSFVATAIFLVVDHLQRRRIPEFAKAEVIEAHYRPQLDRLRELITSYLDGGYGSEFYETAEVFSAEGIEQAAIHTGPTRITVVGGPAIESWDARTRPRPDAKVGRPVVYLTSHGRSVVYRAKVVNADGEEGWYSLTIDLEKLRSMAGDRHLGADPLDKEEPR